MESPSDPFDGRLGAVAGQCCRRDVLRSGAAVSSISLLLSMRGNLSARGSDSSASGDPPAVTAASDEPAPGPSGHGAGPIGDAEASGANTANGTGSNSQRDHPNEEGRTAADDGTGDGVDGPNDEEATESDGGSDEADDSRSDDPGGDGDDSGDTGGDGDDPIDDGGSGGGDDGDGGDEDDDSDDENDDDDFGEGDPGDGDDGPGDGDPDWRDGSVELRETALSPDGALAPDSKCVLDGEFLAEHDLEIGRQIRVRPDEPGAMTDATFTIANAHDDGPARLRLDPAGLDRLDVAGGDSASVDVLAVDPAIETREGALANAEYAEFLRGSADQRRLVALAPHGGHIEPGTDHQAERLAETFDGLAWIAAGYEEFGVAFDRFHVTSTAVHPDSFPSLRSIAGTDFEWGVAFHGFSFDDRILVGGRCEESVKARVRDEIDEALPEMAVEIAPPDGPYAGTSPDNVLNRLAPFDRTIQLEQPITVRRNAADRVVDAVADALADELGSETATL